MREHFYFINISNEKTLLQNFQVILKRRACVIWFTQNHQSVIAERHDTNMLLVILCCHRMTRTAYIQLLSLKKH